ncbi:hypothetical protein SLS63_000619 [Diaporthe eres]|uniref:Uncharacterized protein n=1 Tax=Diaporthe eres TaxID=83184 RepID=A0ABR1PR92_DIAER
MQVNSGKTSPPRLVRPPTRSLTAAAVTGPVALVVDAAVPVPPVSLVLVTAVVVSELEADGAELTNADPVAEGPVLGVCPELAEVLEELKADEVPEVWVPEAEVTDAEPEAPDDEEADSEEADSEEADSEAEDELEEEVDSGAEDELEREELPDGEMMLVD